MNMPAAGVSDNVAVEEIAVRCLLVPLRDMHLLLPNTAIAEVVNYSKPERAEQLPDWVAGLLPWRGRTIPLTSFEKMVGRETGYIHENSRIIVINTISGNSKREFFAITADGIPRLMMVKNDMLEIDAGNRMQQENVVAEVLKVSGFTVLVPDIEMIEKMLDRLV